MVQRLWPPLNVADYGTYIAQIKPNVDGVYAGFAGTNGVRFLKQYKEYQLKPWCSATRPPWTKASSS